MSKRFTLAPIASAVDNLNHTRRTIAMQRTASPATSDDAIEQEIKALGKDKAPRITAEDIKRRIAAEIHFTAAEGATGAAFVAAMKRDPTGASLEHEPPVDIPAELHLLSVCVLVLNNGFTLVGTNACVSPENFDAEIGKKIARQKAFDQAWQYLGFELCTHLALARVGVTVIHETQAPPLSPEQRQALNGAHPSPHPDESQPAKEN